MQPNIKRSFVFLAHLQRSILLQRAGSVQNKKLGSTEQQNDTSNARNEFTNHNSEKRASYVKLGLVKILEDTEILDVSTVSQTSNPASERQANTKVGNIRRQKV
jgi:hypothetical protein